MIQRIFHRILTELTQLKYLNRSKNARVDHRVRVYNSRNLIMEEFTNIDAGAIIMNTRARFVLKKWSGAAIGLTVITGNHMSIPGKHHKMITDRIKNELDKHHEFDKDIVVGEDVWIGAKVTLLSGTTIGRGAIIGAGSVVRGRIPPYAVIFGNPAKIVGFRFTPKEMLVHEEKLFPKRERLPIDVLQSNYEKYYLKRIKEIRNSNNL